MQVAVDVSEAESDPSVEEGEAATVIVDIALLLSLPAFWRGCKALVHVEKESNRARRPVLYRKYMFV